MGAEGAAIWQTASSELERDWSSLPIDDQIDPTTLLLVAQYQLPSQLIVRRPPAAARRFPRRIRFQARCRAHPQTLTQNKWLHPSDSHKRILDCVIAEGTPILVPPLTVAIEAERPSNPLEHAIIVIPVRIEEEIEFVLEVVQRASGGPAAQRGYLRFVAQMADLMSDFLRRHALREQTKRSQRVQQFEYWLGSVSQARDNASQLRSVADALADLFGSFQVFLVRSGARPRVLAASGLDTFDVRSETILALVDVERALSTAASPLAAVTEFDSNEAAEAQARGLPLLHKLLVSDRLVRLELDGHENFCAWMAFTDSVPKLSQAVGRRQPSCGASALRSQVSWTRLSSTPVDFNRGGPSALRRVGERGDAFTDASLDHASRASWSAGRHRIVPSTTANQYHSGPLAAQETHLLRTLRCDSQERCGSR